MLNGQIITLKYYFFDLIKANDTNFSKKNLHADLLFNISNGQT